ncbi:DUF3592 domain-containing protein [bacterium]|nr:DUF3592 domain-containing protein [bacterium]
MQNNKTIEINNPTLTRWAPPISIIAGLIFVVFGVVAHFHQQSYTPATAIVTDVMVFPGMETSDPDRITPTIEYQVDGQTYTTTLAEGQQAYEIGEQINIQYNPQNPNQIIDPNPIGPWALSGFGAIFIVAGIILFWQKRGQSESQDNTSSDRQQTSSAI